MNEQDSGVEVVRGSRGCLTEGGDSILSVTKRLLMLGASATAGCVSRLVTVVFNACSAATD